MTGLLLSLWPKVSVIDQSGKLQRATIYGCLRHRFVSSKRLWSIKVLKIQHLEGFGMLWEATAFLVMLTANTFFLYWLVIFLLDFGYLAGVNPETTTINGYYAEHAPAMVDISSVGFGQIIAITLWIPLIIDWLYSSICMFPPHRCSIRFPPGVRLS